jgi:hypothetical protein
LDLDAITSEIPLFPNSFKCAVQELPTYLPTENNTGNDTLKASIKKNLIEFFKCFPSNEWAQLRSYDHEQTDSAVPICVRRQK